MRTDRVLIPFVLLCASTAALAADPKPEDVVHVDAGKEVRFVLERGRVTEPLPFDVPFFLVTEVDASTKKGIGKVAGRAAGGACGAYTDLPPEALPFSDGTPPKKFLEFAAPPLDANRSFCLGFDIERDRTASELEKFLATMRPKLLHIYTSPRFTPPFLASPEGQRAIREEILDAVRRAVAPAKVVKENARLVLNEKEEAQLRENPDWHPQLATPDDLAPLELRQLVDRPRQFIEEIRNELTTYIERRRQRGEQTTLIPELATAEQVATEIERVRGEIASHGADNATARDLTFILEDNLIDARTLIAKRDAALDAISTHIDRVIVDHYDVLATTTAGYEARFHWYVSADMGMAVAPETDEVFPYIGMNIATRPINKKARLHGWDFRRRFAFTVGLSGNKMSSGDRVGVIDERAVLLGGGLRLNEHIRISGGAEIFNEDDPDPLVTDASLAVTPYVGLSVDVDIAAIVRGFFNSLPGKN